MDSLSVALWLSLHTRSQFPQLSLSLSLWLWYKSFAPALVWCVQTASVALRILYLLLFILSEFNFECVCGCDTNMCTVYPVQHTQAHTQTHTDTDTLVHTSAKNNRGFQASHSG